MKTQKVELSLWYVLGQLTVVICRILLSTVWFQLAYSLWVRIARKTQSHHKVPAWIGRACSRMFFYVLIPVTWIAITGWLNWLARPFAAGWLLTPVLDAVTLISLILLVPYLAFGASMASNVWRKRNRFLVWGDDLTFQVIESDLWSLFRGHREFVPVHWFWYVLSPIIVGRWRIGVTETKDGFSIHVRQADSLNACQEYLFEFDANGVPHEGEYGKSDAWLLQTLVWELPSEPTEFQIVTKSFD
ncbi:TPA: hypothetical protein DEB00_02345 [Candidatus Uhrbacteria bacterium]|nr:hypothetical protein [Candidatus Uhrbacteria bacterium]